MARAGRSSRGQVEPERPRPVHEEPPSWDAQIAPGVVPDSELLRLGTHASSVHESVFVHRTIVIEKGSRVGRSGLKVSVGAGIVESWSSTRTPSLRVVPCAAAPSPRHPARGLVPVRVGGVTSLGSRGARSGCYRFSGSLLAAVADVTAGGVEGVALGCLSATEAGEAVLELHEAMARLKGLQRRCWRTPTSGCLCTSGGGAGAGEHGCLAGAPRTGLGSFCARAGASQSRPHGRLRSDGLSVAGRRH